MKDDPYFAKKLTFSLPTNDGGVLRTVRDVHAYLYQAAEWLTL